MLNNGTVFKMVNENLADKIDDRILWYALQLQQRRKAEIEQAIDQVKNPRKKTTDDKWFRKMWYISQARDRRKQAKEEAAKSRRFATE